MPEKFQTRNFTKTLFDLNRRNSVKKSAGIFLARAGGKWHDLPHAEVCTRNLTSPKVRAQKGSAPGRFRTRNFPETLLRRRKNRKV